MAFGDGIEKLAAEDGLPVELPRIPIGKKVANDANTLGGHLALAPIFEKDGQVVIVDPRTGRIEAMTPSCFVSWVEQYVVFFRYAGENGEVEQSITQARAQQLMDSKLFLQRLRSLRKVNGVRMPVLREGKRLELLPWGYDSATQIWTMEGLEYDLDWSLEQAVVYLKDLLKEFPFAGEDRWSECVQIAAMLSMYVVNMLPRYANRPAFIFNANQARSGKTLLAKLAIAPLAGSLRLTSLPQTPDKRKELLNTVALDADTYLLIDNLEGVINFPELCAFITASQWGDRMMHKQRSFTADNVTSIFLTGNTFTVGDDLQNRSVFVDLYVDEADPQARVIKRTIDNDWCLRTENRAQILSALWAMVKHWDAVGRPMGKKGLADFGAFSEVLSGVVQAAGQGWAEAGQGRVAWGDPFERRQTESGGNEELSDFRALLRVLYDAGEAEGLWSGDSLELRFPQITHACAHHGLFSWVLQPDDQADEEFRLESPGEIPRELDAKTRSRFGKLISRRTGASERGSVYAIDADRRVRVRHYGKGRSRKLVLEKLPQG